MADRRTSEHIIERQNYVIILVVGVALLCLAAVLYLAKADPFLQNLLLSLGANMVVITLIFMVFKVFRAIEQQTEITSTANLPSQVELVNRGELLSTEITKLVKQLYSTGQYDDVLAINRASARPLWVSGQYDRLSELGDLSKTSAQKLGRTEDYIRSLIDEQGWVNVILGKVDTAKTNIKHGISIAIDEGNFYYAAKGYRHLGGIAQNVDNDHDQAQRYFDQAEQLAEKVADSRIAAEILAGINYARAISYMKQGALQSAEQFAKRALEKYTQQNDQPRLVKTRNLLGAICLKSGDIDRAKSIFKNTLEEAKSIGRSDQIATSLRGMGEVYFQEQRFDAAQASLKQAIEIFNEIGATSSVKEVEVLLAQIRDTA